MLKPVDNPPNPWLGSHVEWIDAPPPASLKVFEESARSIVSENHSPDVGFRFSANPYRGCFHGCAYCYARPTHQYLDFGAGTDFERKLVVKTNAPQLLRTEFAKSSWKGERLILSGNTDCYQPLEASYRLTRAMLEVCTEFRNPVGIITKSAVIRGDLDVLKELNSVADLSVAISIPFLDSEMARALEPGAPTPKVRFDTIRALASIGIQVTVAVAPIIPGLNDSQIPGILAAAADAGATAAFRIMLRLPAEVKPVFLERLEQHYPLRASKVISGVRAARGGELYRAEFGSRMSGEGERWAMIERVFDLACKRAGLVSAGESESASMPVKHGATFRRPTSQQSLF